MPIPHRTQQQMIKRRLVGKRLRAGARAPRDPGRSCRTTRTAIRRPAQVGERADRRDAGALARRHASRSPSPQGAAQIAFVGPPNAGKSSLLQALSNVQIKTGDYAFTTTRPVRARRGSAACSCSSSRSGLIEGAAEDRGGGRRCSGSCATPTRSCSVMRRNVGRRARRCAPRSAPPGSSCRRSPPRPRSTRDRRSASGARRRSASVLDDESLDRLRDAVWRLTGLIRVHLRGGVNLRDGGDPVALHPPATVHDVARSIHHELAATAVGARVWGPSARFEGPAGRARARARRRRPVKALLR